MRPKFPVHLHRHAPIGPLPMEEVRAILRGADPLIGAGGRTLLAKLLKGSHSQDVLRHGLEQNPSHGFYQHLTPEEILDRIDWTIVNRYLRIEYDGRLPVLVYTPLGWSIERETYADEILRGFEEKLASSDRPYDMHYLKDRNREVILRVLEKVQESGDRRYLEILEDWKLTGNKKVRHEINNVIQRLTDGEAVGRQDHG
jgi:hypothetical protein